MKIKIKGGIPLKGEVTPIPNKNSILAAWPVCLLTNEDVIYKDVPDTSDVDKMLKILEGLGANVQKISKSEVKINCANVKHYKVDKDSGNAIRASILFAGPLLARFGRAEIPLPGGCKLGQRSIAAHIDVFKKFGVEISFANEYVIFTLPKKEKYEEKIWQFEASVTATENLVMLAAGVNCEVDIIDAASEPHVKDLLNCLVNMGAEIQGIGSNRLFIKSRGISNLKGTIFTPGYDFVDIAGYIVAAAVTKGEIKINGANDFDLVGGMIQVFSKFNINFEKTGNDLIVKGNSQIKIDADNSGFPLAEKGLPKFTPRPWPGFPVDVLPVMVTLASKSEGKILINNWMYENGLTFIHDLNQLGAKIEMLTSQNIIVNGPVKFLGGSIKAQDVIQASKAMFLAALADDTETILDGVEILKRRYPNILEVYKSLGANIEVLEA
jgi:UDP-N-acetylglucosamine 1-carboxyvinyltransferase